MYTRQKRVVIDPHAYDGMMKITGEMEDDRHNFCLELLVDDQELIIKDIELSMLRFPESRCKECEKTIKKLIGAQLLHTHFRSLLIRRIGGERGCFHVMELLYDIHDFTRSRVMDSLPEQDGSYTISRIQQKGKIRCIGYRK